MSNENFFDDDIDVLTVKPQTMPKEPILYAVIMHNDDYTTMDFVVNVLLDFFDYTTDKAVMVMLQIHNQGQAVIATYPKEIAEMKVTKVLELAEVCDFPLLVTLKKLL